MSSPPNRHLQFVVDSEGRKVAVILPVEEYEEILQDFGDLATLAERRDEPSLPHEEVIAELGDVRHLSDSSS